MEHLVCTCFKQKCTLLHEIMSYVVDTWNHHKEKKYTGLSKSNTQNISRRQRKKEHPSRLPAVTHISSILDEKSHDDALFCKKSAGRAVLSSQDRFCKRCSCCIYH